MCVCGVCVCMCVCVGVLGHPYIPPEKKFGCGRPGYEVTFNPNRYSLTTEDRVLSSNTQ